jgi:uncharacterized protein (TIGR03067 family)
MNNLRITSQRRNPVAAVVTLVMSVVLGAGGQRLIAGDDPKADAAKDELKKLQETWDATAAWLPDGNPWREDLVKTFHLKIDQNRMTSLRDGSQGSNSFTIQLDPSRTPKSIDCTVSNDGPRKGLVRYAIYELDGDTLKLAMDTTLRPGRPKGFEKGKGWTVTIFKRVKPQS